MSKKPIDTTDELPFPELSLPVMVDLAVKTLQAYAPADGSPYYVGYSGGKDSVVIAHLCKLAGVPYELHYSVTTIDPPELVRFVKATAPRVIMHRPEKNFFAMMEQRGYPSRLGRWCCSELKENKCAPGSSAVFGIRADESARRAAQWQGIVSQRKTKGGRFVAVCPILFWRERDVWEFIRSENLPYCSLYDEGFRRLGCVGCPMSHNRYREIQRWPGFERLWRKALRAWWDNPVPSRESRTRRTFKTFEEFWAWYWSNESMPEEIECTGQNLF